MLALPLRLAVAVSLLTALSVAQQDEATIAIRSLLPFVRSEAPLRPLTSAVPNDWNERAGLDAIPPVAPATWVGEVLNARHRQPIEAGRLRVGEIGQTADGGSPRGGALLVQGEPPDVQAWCRDFDAMAAAFARPIEVIAMRLPLAAGELPATTWDANTLQQQLQRTPPSWSSRGRTRSGETLRLAGERGTGVLRDLDVEIASDARITDPKVDLTFTGLRATVAVHALDGDEIVLAGSWLASELVAVHDQPIGVGLASIDLPEHKTAWATFAGRVPSGGALVVAGRGGSIGPDGFVLVVSARFAAPPANDPAPDLIVRSAGALLPWPTFGRPQLLWRVPGEDRAAFPFEADAEGIDEASLRTLLASRSAGEVEIHHGMVVAHGGPGVCRHAEAVVRQLAALLQPRALHSRVVGVGDAAPLELVQPILGARSAAAFVGTERAVLYDQEVEIAEKAQLGNPVVGVIYGGLWYGACAAPQRGDWHVAGAWTVCAQSEPRVREHAEKPPMTMQLVDYRATVLPWDAPMAAGREHVLGDGPPWTAGGKPTQVTVQLVAP